VLLIGTVAVRRPRVRNLDERFVSRMLPLFQRRTPEVAHLLPARLVLISGLADGTKVVLAVESGHRQSTESWAEILRDLTGRGLSAPGCIVADGALGLGSAVAHVWPKAAEQRCWNHKLRNVVDAVPLRQHPDVQEAVQRIAAAETVAGAEHERQAFHRACRQRFSKACERLDRDWARMLTYDQFLKEHWRYLCTTNVVESVRQLVSDVRAKGVCGFKSIVAYRTGLSIGHWDIPAAMMAFQQARLEVRASGAVRLGYKALLDTLLHIAFDAAAEQELPVQIDVGYGDPDVDLRTSSPLELRSLFENPRYRAMSIVMLHGCWP
jgi:hypothetical protein